MSTPAASRPAPVRITSYLDSPIKTLLYSLESNAFDHISGHDILDAYHNLSRRIQDNAPTLITADTSQPALQALKDAGRELARVLRRDISRASKDEWSDPACSALAGNSSAGSHRLHAAQESIAICHCALRLFSEISSFESLWSQFPEDCMGAVLDDVIGLALGPELQTPNRVKTQSLLVWVLRVQRLSIRAHSPRVAGITSTLRRALAGHLYVDPTTTHGPVVDALAAVRELLLFRPGLFMASFVKELLPAVLNYLVSPLAHLRLGAGQAFLSFANLLQTLPVSPSIRAFMTSEVHDFVLSQTSRRRTTAANPKPLTSTLPSLLSSAFSPALTSTPAPSTGQRADAHHATWAIAVLASIVIITDRTVFSQPRVLKLVLRTLEQAAVPRSASHAGMAHALIWRCLAWAFSGLEAAAVASSVEHTEEQDDAEDYADLADRAFLVVKQELRGGAGLALAAGLLGCSDPGGSRRASAVAKAVAVMKEMVQSASRTLHADGRALLVRLAGAIGTDASAGLLDSVWERDALLSEEIFDWQFLGGSGAASASSVDIKLVRPLGEMELLAEWDALIEAWFVCASRAPRDPVIQRLPRELIQTWQALLLVQSQLTQGNGHLTTSPSITSRSVSIAARFFAQPAAPAAHTDDPVPMRASADSQRGITVVHQLWAVLTQVFTLTTLGDAAEQLLTQTLAIEFDLADAGVRRAWSALCADLVRVGRVGLVELLKRTQADGREDAVSKGLWGIVAGRWAKLKCAEDGRTWEDAVGLLVMPLRNWSISEDEEILWHALCHAAMEMTVSAAVPRVAVVEAVLERLSPEFNSSQMTTNILCHLAKSTASCQVDTLPLRLLHVFDQRAHSLYQSGPEHCPAGLELLKTLHALIKQIPSSLMKDTISSISTGLGVWLRDEESLVSDDEYNETIVPIYCDALDALRTAPLTTADLSSLERFFTAAFVHIPPPALGPTAFKTFWDATFGAAKTVRDACPVEIRTCLKAYADAYGESIPSELASSYDYGHDSGSLSIVLDSQPPPPPPYPFDNVERGERSQGRSSPALFEVGMASGRARPSPSEVASPDKPQKRRKLSEPVCGIPGPSTIFTTQKAPRRPLARRNGSSSHHPPSDDVLPPSSPPWPSSPTSETFGTGIDEVAAWYRQLAPSNALATLEDLTGFDGVIDRVGNIAGQAMPDGTTSEAPLTRDFDRAQPLLGSPFHHVDSRHTTIQRTHTELLPRGRSNDPVVARPFPQRSPTAPVTTSSARRLQALQEAYDALTTSGASQMQINDLLRANQLVNRMSSVLSEQLSSKWGDPVPGPAL